VWYFWLRIYLFFLFIYKLINVGLHVVRNASKNGRSAASGLGEKADSVIAVKRNAEFNAAVNATIIYVTTSGCRCIHQLENAVLHIYCSNTNLTANSCWLNSHKVYFSTLMLPNSSKHLIMKKHDVKL